MPAVDSGCSCAIRLPATGMMPSRPASRTRPQEPRPARMLILIDNYDSFTYNLVHYLGEQIGRAHV